MSITENAATFAHQNPKRKNIIINGDFQVWQQSDNRASVASGSTTADMWKVHNTTASTIGYSRQFGNSIDGHYSVQVLNATADTSITAADQCHIGYRAEGTDVSHLASGSSYAATITLSFWHLHTVTGTYCVSISNNKLGTANRSYVVEYTQSTTNNWERSEFTIDLDTTGTWASGVNQLGMEIRFALVAGTTFHTTADAWQAGAYLATSNQVNGFDAINNLNRIASVKLEVGSEATDFEADTFADTLIKCQRYWQSNINYGVYPTDNPGHNGALPNVTAINGTTYYGNIVFPVEMMKATPTMSYYRDGGGTKNGAWTVLVGSWQNSTTTNGNVILQDSGFVTSNAGHTLTTGYSYTARGFWVAEAEL